MDDQVVEQWLSEGRIVSVCPEVEAGMTIPRKPAEIFSGDGYSVLSGESVVIENDGNLVTDYFVSGASMALELCKKFDIGIAVLAESSPSCGSAFVYDGSFSGNRTSGVGVTTALLRRHGIRVFSQYEIADANKAVSQMSCVP